MSKVTSLLFRRSPSAAADAALLALRIVAGLAFMNHGWRKIQDPLHWMGDDAAMPALLQAAAAVSEFGGGFAWILGILTPLASLGILCTMSVAVWTHVVERGDPFVGKDGSYELALLFGTIALLLFFGGPGRFSIDARLARRGAAALFFAFGLGVGAPIQQALAAPSDPDAVTLAESTIAAMGGREAWDSTRYLQWRFFGRRSHLWDKATGDVRIEADSTLILMNLGTKTGRVFESGVEVVDPVARAKVLEDGYAMWVNDSYWLLMPYKLLDPGVRLTDARPSPLADGRPAHRITMTFDSVGLTPLNKYNVWIGDDTKLVEQWAYYENASDVEPKFSLPWAGWQRFGRILLATDHGKPADWQIGVPAEVARAKFEMP